MSYGLPVVASSASIEGMSLIPDRDILVADDAEQFARSVVRLYKDDRLWSQLSSAGLENVKEQFSSDTARRAIEDLLEQLERQARPLRANPRAHSA
jgi:glycosyltransferase involved in cell wall biosynthesis